MISRFEARRQVFHIILGVLLALLVYFELIDFAALLVIVVVGLGISIISRKHDILIISWFLDMFEREEDKKRFPGRGSFYYIVGALIVYGLFITQPDGKSIVAASLVILALGDSMPHFVAHMARVKNPFSNVKYIEASTFGVMLAFLGAVFFVEPLEALLASFVAMFIEGIDLKIGLEIDDNMIVPVVAGSVIFLMRLLL